MDNILGQYIRPANVNFPMQNWHRATSSRTTSLVYSTAELDARRKYEVLKHSNNSSKLTKAQRFSRLNKVYTPSRAYSALTPGPTSASASGVPGEWKIPVINSEFLKIPVNGLITRTQYTSGSDNRYEYYNTASGVTFPTPFKVLTVESIDIRSIAITEPSGSLVWGSELDDINGRGARVVAHTNYDNSKNTITLITNEYPSHDVSENTLPDGPYAELPGPQYILGYEIQLYGISSERAWDDVSKNNVISYLPTFGELGFLGRPHKDLSTNTHWTKETCPKELIPLDPLSKEAWDLSVNDASMGYMNRFRFNVLGIIKNSHIHDISNLQYIDGSYVTHILKNDSFYAHVQPTNSNDISGAYHYHGFKSGEIMDLSNLVVGYSFDGYAIMGQNTEIYDTSMVNGVAVDISGEWDARKPSASGYVLLDSSSQEVARGFTNVNIDISNLWINSVYKDVSGIFHADFSWNDISAANIKGNSYNFLDKYNMGFVNLNNQIEKVYVCTDDYPYTIHTRYHGENNPSSFIPFIYANKIGAIDNKATADNYLSEANQWKENGLSSIFGLTYYTANTTFTKLEDIISGMAYGKPETSISVKLTPSTFSITPGSSTESEALIGYIGEYNNDVYFIANRDNVYLTETDSEKNKYTFKEDVLFRISATECVGGQVETIIG